MTWLKEDQMARVHEIRKAYAVARNTAEAEPTPENVAAFKEQEEIRARAMRQFARDSGTSVSHISAMFRCSKTTVREALRKGPQG